MTETIQQLKEDIAILQERLQKLEEQNPDMMLFRQGKVDIVDYDRRTFYRIEYTDSFSGVHKWYEREKTSSMLIPIRDNSNVFDLLEEFYQKQVIKQKGEYTYGKGTPEEVEKLQKNKWYVDPKTLLISNWEPKPQTPEETEKSLKDAMKTAQEQGVFDNPEPEPEPETLKQLLSRWGSDFAGKWANPEKQNREFYEEEVDRFIQMFTEWMPDASDDGESELDEGWDSYRYVLMRKLK